MRVSASAALVAGFARDRAVRSAFLLGDPALVGLAAVRASGRARAALLARVLPGERLAGAGDVLADAQRGLGFGVGVADAAALLLGDLPAGAGGPASPPPDERLTGSSCGVPGVLMARPFG